MLSCVVVADVGGMTFQRPAISISDMLRTSQTSHETLLLLREDLHNSIVNYTNWVLIALDLYGKTTGSVWTLPLFGVMTHETRRVWILVTA